MLRRLLLAIAFLVSVTTATHELVSVAPGQGAPVPVADGCAQSNESCGTDSDNHWDAQQSTSALNGASGWVGSDVHARVASLFGPVVSTAHPRGPLSSNFPQHSKIYRRAVPLLI